MITNKATMTAEERLQATIRHEKTDKIPCSPSIMTFVAKYSGMTMAEMLNNEERTEEAYDKMFNELGGWDVMMNGPNSADTAILGMTMKLRLPGRELPDNIMYQWVEEENMTVEDYDKVAEIGWPKFIPQLQQRIHPEMTPDDFQRLGAKMGARNKARLEKWRSRGVASVVGGAAGIPFAGMSYARSLAKFALDVRRMPEKIKAAVDASVEDSLAMGIRGARAVGNPFCQITGSRASATFISPKQFEYFVLPWLTRVVKGLVAEGITPLFHFDADWGPFLHYFVSEFPPKTCIFWPDGMTDIFEAKKILRGHTAILGDVPASLLSLGTPEQVTDYCKRLIEEVGEGGGFLLGTGCELPFDAKVENVQALIRAGNELAWN